MLWLTYVVDDTVKTLDVTVIPLSDTMSSVPDEREFIVAVRVEKSGRAANEMGGNFEIYAFSPEYFPNIINL